MNEYTSGKRCPYCKKKTRYTDSSIIYRKSYGMIYICTPCKAWVGVHNGTNKSLGRLANEELRKSKQEAHKYLDSLWRRKVIEENINTQAARSKAYKWLGNKMGKKPNEVHIGMFDVDDCKKVIELCRPYYKDII